LRAAGRKRSAAIWCNPDLLHIFPLQTAYETVMPGHIPKMGLIADSKTGNFTIPSLVRNAGAGKGNPA